MYLLPRMLLTQYKHLANQEKNKPSDKKSPSYPPTNSGITTIDFFLHHFFKKKQMELNYWTCFPLLKMDGLPVETPKKHNNCGGTGYPIREKRNAEFRDPRLCSSVQP